MKNKIKGFAKGDFKMERPEIYFSETHLKIAVAEGEKYEGNIKIFNQKDGYIRGIVYPSSFRVQFANQGFEGNPVELSFTFDSSGLKPGHVEKGSFSIVCNGGEYEITFVAIVEKPFIDTEYGKICDVAGLKKLAKIDFTEAKKLFRSRQFMEVLKYEESRIYHLYVNMRKWSLDDQALEEFLVGTKQKERIFLSVSEENIFLENVLDDKKQVLDIEKNTWGYLPVRVRADGEFIRLTTKEFTTDNFIANSFALEYYICAEQLHQGQNFGAIIVETPYETISVEICIKQTSKQTKDFGMVGMLMGQALKTYLQYVGDKMDKETWRDRMLISIDQIQEYAPEDPYYMLLKAHVNYIGGRKEEAGWILEKASDYKVSASKNPDVMAYYLFVNAIVREENAYKHKVVEEITKLYMKNLYHWPLLCMLVRLDPKYSDGAEKLRVFERQFSNGANSVIMYADAYSSLKNNVVLLRKLGAFEIQVLDFATKYKIISKELAIYMAELMAQQKKYDERFCKILIRAYRMYDEPKILQAICAQMIKGERTDKSCFKWYSKAIQQGLKIAQLYEFYMQSLDSNKFRGPLPRIVYLYFLHGNQLSYKKAALLYADILTHEDEDSDIYRSYQDKIRQFAWEQLLKRHISEPLRIIYNKFLKEAEMKPEHIEALRDICYAYEVKTERKDMAYVKVIEKDGSVTQIVPYKEDGAVVYLYDKEARIVWESREGVHYTDSIPYDTKRLFYEIPFMSLVRKYQSAKIVSGEEEIQKADLENIKLWGPDAFDEKDVFLVCTKTIRERGYEEDDFITYLAFSLLKNNQYDKVTITYLAKFFCGATSDMKFVWKKAKEFGVPAFELAERIITQMIFAETMFHEEKVFADYYSGKPYFRLKQAYLAYISKEYVVKGRELDDSIFIMMLREISSNEYLADICKVAILKYFSDKEYSNDVSSMLYEFLQECGEKNLIFSFCMNYPKEWLRKLQLYDKVFVEYKANGDGKVKLLYDINNVEGTETLLPIYENLYVKSFVLYANETLRFEFVEETKDGIIGSGKEQYHQPENCLNYGKFGRINELQRLPEEEQKEELLKLYQEDAIAKMFFTTR